MTELKPSKKDLKRWLTELRKMKDLGYLSSQDIYYVGNIKQQTFIILVC
ncbi:MAG: hypothetical protein U0X86_000311 [Wolbachia endosymbiont of Xenopsylla cheopis]